MLVDDISSLGGNHNGGDLDVGSDGNLYVSIGDAGTDPRQDGGINAARDLSLLNGKILRITLDGQPAPGNPLSGAGTEACATRGNLPSTPTTSCQELFAWGLRNPYRIAFDPNGGGDRFFINDVGQSSREEVDEGGIGRNYGWNQCEGFCPGGPPPGITDPLTDYPRTVGTVITGGAFVPDGLWPADLDGGYLFSDAGSGSIFLRRANGTIDYATPWATDAAGIADMVFAFDEAGRTALYYTNNGDGELRKIVWNGQTASPTPSNLAFSAIAPTRAYDTRTGLGVTGGDVRSDTTRLVDLPTPSPAVQAALVNITVTNNAGWGFLEAWAPRSLRPPTSVVNVVQPGEDVANASVVTLDAEGRFVLHAAMATDVVVDVLGWFSTTPGTATAGRFVAVDPGRLIDTRHPAGAPLSSGSNEPVRRDGRSRRHADRRPARCACRVGHRRRGRRADGARHHRRAERVRDGSSRRVGGAQRIERQHQRQRRHPRQPRRRAGCGRRFVVGDARARRRRDRRRGGLLHVGGRPAVGERAVHGRRADPPVRRTRAGRAAGAVRRIADPRSRQPACPRRAARSRCCRISRSLRPPASTS